MPQRRGISATSEAKAKQLCNQELSRRHTTIGRSARRRAEGPRMGFPAPFHVKCPTSTAGIDLRTFALAARTRQSSPNKEKRGRSLAFVTARWKVRTGTWMAKCYYLRHARLRDPFCTAENTSSDYAMDFCFWRFNVTLGVSSFRSRPESRIHVLRRGTACARKGGDGGES